MRNLQKKVHRAASMQNDSHSYNRLFKNIQMQGAQNMRNEAYLFVRRSDECFVQHSRWVFFNSLLEPLQLCRHK